MRKKRDENALKVFSDNLKNLMSKYNITATKLSRDLDVNKTSVSQWINKVNFPSPDKMKKLADYLNVTVDYLYGGQKPKVEEDKILPDSIDTYEDAVAFLRTLDLYGYGGVNLNQKTEEQLMALARTLLSILKI